MRFFVPFSKRSYWAHESGISIYDAVSSIKLLTSSIFLAGMTDIDMFQLKSDTNKDLRCPQLLSS